MPRKFGLLLLGLIVASAVTLYLEGSPTAKRWMEVVERKLREPKIDSLVMSQPKVTEKETISFLGKPTVMDRSGEILISYEAIEKINSRMLKQLISGKDKKGLEIYGSSQYSGRFLAVYDVIDSLPATVNRHLNNHVLENRWGPDHDNIHIDLEGYSIFLYYFKNDDGSYQKISNVRWIPSELKDHELQYERYEEQLDLEIGPNYSVNNEYLNVFARSDMDMQHREQRRERIYKLRDRYITKDASGVSAILPFKKN